MQTSKETDDKVMQASDDSKALAGLEAAYESLQAQANDARRALILARATAKASEQAAKDAIKADYKI